MKNIVLVVIFSLLFPTLTSSASVHSGKPVLGTLRAIIAENFDDKTGNVTSSEIRYQLETSRGLIEIRSRQDLGKFVNQPVQAELGRNGFANVTPLAPARVTTDPGVLTIPPPSMRRRDTLVLLLNHQNNPWHEVNLADVQDKMFTGQNSANAFWKKASLNQMWLSGIINPQGDVQDWETLSMDNTNCSYNFPNVWAPQGDAIAEANGFSRTAYKFRIYLVPPGSGCSPTAFATVGNYGDEEGITRAYIQLPDSPIILSQTVSTFSHEIGHMLGIATHSGYQETESSPVIDADDKADIMGNGSYLPQNINRVRLGWLMGKMLDISEPGVITQTLLPTVTMSRRGYKVIRIPLKDAAGNFIGKSIWLESRKNLTPGSYEYFATNHQTFVTGIAIRYVEDDIGSQFSKSIIRDATPGSPLGSTDAPLQQGLAYVDSTYGVTIELIYASDTLGDRVRITTTR